MGTEAAAVEAITGVEMLIMAGVFVVASAVGYFLISRVPSLIHTPLMSMTNALSAVTILGGILLFSKEVGTIELVLGAVALVAASFNLFGGYMVSHRMLKMCKSKKALSCLGLRPRASPGGGGSHVFRYRHS